MSQVQTSKENAPPRSLRPKHAAEYLDVSLATLWRWAAERPDFPRSRKIGPRVTVWDAAELSAWRDAHQVDQQ